MFEWHVVRHGSIVRYPKDMFKTDWIMCSKYANHLRFNGQLNDSMLPHDSSTPLVR